MKIRLNGEDFEIQQAATLTQLIEMMTLQSSRYAIEVNNDIVPRSEHGSYSLKQGDHVEVVQAIGGG